MALVRVPRLRQGTPQAGRAVTAYDKLRRSLYDREDGLCQRCTREASDVHHRKLRSRGGGDDDVNCVLLCAECHTWCHRNPAVATETGWMVPGMVDPATVTPVPLGHVGVWSFADEAHW